jgi:hypothetical protein
VNLHGHAPRNESTHRGRGADSEGVVAASGPCCPLRGDIFSLVGTVFRGPGKLLLWFAETGVRAESNHEGRSVTSVWWLIGITQLPVSPGVFVTPCALQFSSLIPIWVESPAGYRESP